MITQRWMQTITAMMVIGQGLIMAAVFLGGHELLLATIPIMTIANGWAGIAYGTTLRMRRHEEEEPCEVIDLRSRRH